MSSFEGGWSSFGTVSEDDKKVFDAALRGLVGCSYTPLLVATQVVAGRNYCFLCKGEVVVPERPEFAALVYIYQPLEGEPHLMEIKRLTP
jgi:hypothetical protein